MVACGVQTAPKILAMAQQGMPTIPRRNIRIGNLFREKSEDNHYLTRNQANKAMCALYLHEVRQPRFRKAIHCYLETKPEFDVFGFCDRL